MKDNNAADVEGMARSRYTELKGMLEERRSQLQAEVQEKMRDVRAEGLHGKMTEVFDAVESSEADIQEDIELALIQMKSETLTKVNDALVRLEHGTYGYCFECGEEIAEKRLRALPFAELQGLRGREGSRRAASTAGGSTPRRVVVVSRHVTFRAVHFKGPGDGRGPFLFDRRAHPFNPTEARSL